MLLNIVTYLDETCNSLVTIAFKITKFTSATTFMVVGIFGAKKYHDSHPRLLMYLKKQFVAVVSTN